MMGFNLLLLRVMVVLQCINTPSQILHASCEFRSRGRERGGTSAPGGATTRPGAMKRVVLRGGSEDQEWHEGLMFMHGQRFSEEIGQVVGALAPLDDEVALQNAIAHPVKAHIERPGLAEFDSVHCDADGAGIVAEHEGGRLWVTKFYEDGAYPLTERSVGEQRRVFAFGSRCNDDIDDVAEGVDGAVDGSGIITVTKVENATCDAAGTGAGQVRAIGLDV